MGKLFALWGLFLTLIPSLFAFNLGYYEEEFMKFPDPANILDHLEKYTEKPHIAGTIEGFDTAVYTKKEFEKYGISAKLVSHRVTLSYPIERSLEITYPENQRFTASLEEDAIPEDPTSGHPKQVMTYNAYSGSGNVTAELVYVNYGRLEDFLYLESIGVSVQGKICIARYGSVFRGNKAFFAEERGAIGLLIYSDPIDDGYSRGDIYPEGPWRPPSAVQRGSCLYLPICPGDPGKPQRCGGVERIRPSLPILPISYEDAIPFLSGLTGNASPENWKGGLNIDYFIGPGPVRVNLYVKMREEPTTIWNVIAEIPGAIEPDRRVILGNHRDAWNPGALDPNSGTSVLLEIARSFGELLELGWKPRRTIQFGSWDAEEFGLIGSVEWGEVNEEILKEQTIVYLNVDIGVSGPNFGASASPSISNLLRNRTSYITDPNSQKPLSEVWAGQVSALGSGSDFAVFVQYLGIGSMDMSFSGSYGVYHSVYDSLNYIKTFSDPTFVYHKTMTQLLGLIVMAFSDSSILPFDYKEFCQELEKYADTILRLAEEAGGSLDVSPILNSIEELENASNEVTQQIQRCSSPTQNCSNEEIRELNDRLAFTERRFTNPVGLPKRPWYKNVVFASGYETGYAPDVFPGVSDAIRDRNWGLADLQIQIIADAISNAAAFLSGN